MIKELRTFLENVQYLNLKDIAIFADITTVKKLKPGEYLVKTGERNQSYFMVLKGMMRNYAELPNGEEKTMRLSYEGMSTSTPSVLTDGMLATETIIALEDSLVACVERERLEKLIVDRPNIAALYVEQLKVGLMEANEMIRFFTTLSPEERYIYLRDNHPVLIQRVQLNYLASFMGVSPVSLYRIRARVAKSGK